MSIAPGLLPEGLRDRLPPEAAAADRLLRAMTDVFAGFGYERVQPPLVEYEANLGARLGGEARRELLRFTDPVSQHTLALRSDITGQVGRIAVTRMAARVRPLRLAYAGPVLRVRGTQLAPERESLQIGVELIGSDEPAAAAEVLAIAIAALRAAGLSGLSVDLTLPTLVAELAAAGWPLGNLSRGDAQALLDGKDAGALAAAGAQAFVPLIAAAGPAGSALTRLAALDMPAAVATRLTAVAELVAGLAVAATLDPTERHGFEYQTWLGFSLFGDGIIGEVGRGGAYAITRPDGGTEPAIGFSLYVDGLVNAGLGQMPERRLFLPLGTDAEAATRLRAEGWATVAALSAADTAAALGCTYRLAGGEVIAVEQE